MLTADVAQCFLGDSNRQSVLFGDLRSPDIMTTELCSSTLTGPPWQRRRPSILDGLHKWLVWETIIDIQLAYHYSVETLFKKFGISVVYRLEL